MFLYTSFKTTLVHCFKDTDGSVAYCFEFMMSIEYREVEHFSI